MGLRSLCSSLLTKYNSNLVILLHRWLLKQIINFKLNCNLKLLSLRRLESDFLNRGLRSHIILAYFILTYLHKEGGKVLYKWVKFWDEQFVISTLQSNNYRLTSKNNQKSAHQPLHQKDSEKIIWLATSLRLLWTNLNTSKKGRPWSLWVFITLWSTFYPLNNIVLQLYLYKLRYNI